MLDFMTIVLSKTKVLNEAGFEFSHNYENTHISFTKFDYDINGDIEMLHTIEIVEHDNNIAVLYQAYDSKANYHPVKHEHSVKKDVTLVSLEVGNIVRSSINYANKELDFI